MKLVFQLPGTTIAARNFGIVPQLVRGKAVADSSPCRLVHAGAAEESCGSQYSTMSPQITDAHNQGTTGGKRGGVWESTVPDS